MHNAESLTIVAGDTFVARLVARGVPVNSTLRFAIASQLGGNDIIYSCLVNNDSENLETGETYVDFAIDRVITGTWEVGSYFYSVAHVVGNLRFTAIAGGTLMVRSSVEGPIL